MALYNTPTASLQRGKTSPTTVAQSAGAVSLQRSKIPPTSVVQSAVAVEYTDCISEEG